MNFNGVRRVIIDGNGGFSSSRNQSGKGNKGVSIAPGGCPDKGTGTPPGGTKYLLFRNTNESYPVFALQNKTDEIRITNCYI